MQVADIMVPLLKFWFHEDVRRAAVQTLPELLRSAVLSRDKGINGVDNAYVKQVWVWAGRAERRGHTSAEFVPGSRPPCKGGRLREVHEEVCATERVVLRVGGCLAAAVQLLDYMWPAMMDALGKEPDAEVQTAHLDSIAEIIELVRATRWGRKGLAGVGKG